MNYHAILLTALSLLASHASFAQEKGAARHPYTDTTHMVGIGGAFQETDAEFRATVGELPPATVDLNDLGVDEDDFSWALGIRYTTTGGWR